MAPSRTAAAALFACAIGSSFAQQCDETEPSLSWDMASIEADSCDSTAADAVCVHACIDGYEGGSVTCGADGVWTVVACTPDEDWGNLPTLPDQFETKIEANIVNKGYTIHMHEWYDVPADMSRTDLYSQRSGGTSSSIYDYADNLYLHINEDGSGEWGDMDHISGRNIMNSGGGAHVTSSANFFRFGGEMEEVYKGRESARGIWCDKWEAMTTRPGSWMKLEYYFSAPEYDMPETDGSRVPVRLRLTGSRTRLTRESCTKTPGTDAQEATEVTDCTLTKVVEAACEAVQLADGSVTTCTLNNDSTGCDKEGQGVCNLVEAVVGSCAVAAGSGTCDYVTPGQDTGVPPHTYDHYYEYENFHVGPPDPSAFQMQCAVLYTSTNTTWNPATKGPLPCPGNCDGTAPFRTGSACPATPTPPAGNPTMDCFCDDEMVMQMGNTLDEGCAAIPGTDEEEAANATLCDLTAGTTEIPAGSCALSNSAAAGSCVYMAAGGSCPGVISELSDSACPGEPIPPCADDERMGYMPGGCPGLKASYGCDADLHTANDGAYARWMPEGTLLSSRCAKTCETCPDVAAGPPAADIAAVEYMKPMCCEPTLPTLPTQFSTIISANIARGSRGNPYTVHMHEWVDAAADKGRTDLYSTRAGGTSSSVYDYADNIYWHVDADGTGTWGDMDHISGRNMFGGGAHVTSTASMLRFGGDMEETYVGREAARGIMCDKWTSSSARFGSTMQLDWYFSANGWDTPEAAGERVPIRLQLTGSRQSFSREGCTAVPGTDEEEAAEATSCDLTAVVGESCAATQADDDTETTCAVSDTGGNCTATGTGSCAYTAPIVGSCARTAGTGSCTYVAPRVPIGEPHVYDHIYDYTSFHVGPPNGIVFDQPCGMEFISTNTTWNPKTLPNKACPVQCAACQIEGDLNMDAIVNVDDILMLLSNFNVQCV